VSLRIFSHRYDQFAETENPKKYFRIAQLQNQLKFNGLMPQSGAVSRHPLEEPNQASQVQPDGSWEASALLQLPVYDIFKGTLREDVNLEMVAR
jgi:hypothetical protein